MTSASKKESICFCNVHRSQRINGNEDNIVILFVFAQHVYVHVCYVDVM